MRGSDACGAPGGTSGYRRDHEAFPDREARIEPLTSRQRAFLRSLAQDLKAAIRIGGRGLSPSSVEAVREALSARELLKVKVLDASSDAARVGEALAAELGDAHLVQVIGRTLVLYRPHPDAPRLRLPG